MKPRKKTKPRKKVLKKKALKTKPIAKLKVEKSVEEKEETKEDMRLRFSTTLSVVFRFNKDEFPMVERKAFIDSLCHKIKDLNIQKGGVSLIILSARLL